MSDEDTRKRAAAYLALMDALTTESGHWLLGKRDDPDRIAFLSEAVRDPSTVVIEPKTQPTPPEAP